MKERYDKLKELGYEVIREEGLPVPTDIKFKFYLNGTHQEGTCFRKSCENTNSFRILINTIRPKYVFDKEKRTRMRRVMGTERPFKQIIDTTAHEIAHLKFWDHGPQHTSYTNYLFDKLKEKMGVLHNEDEI